MARLVWAERRTYLPGAIFVVVSIGTALAYPQVIRLIIDDGIIGGQAPRLNQLSLWMVVILLVEAAATGARDYFFGLGAERVGVRLRRLVFGTLLRQDIQFFDRREVGEITTRLSADVPPLEYVLGEEFADSLRFAVFSVLGTALLFYTSPPLTLLTLLAVPPIIFATSVLGRRVKVLSAKVQQATPRPAPRRPKSWPASAPSARSRKRPPSVRATTGNWRTPSSSSAGRFRRGRCSAACRSSRASAPRSSPSGSAATSSSPAA